MQDSLIMNYRSRVLLAVQTTAAGAGGYLAPTGGSSSYVIRCIATMGNAADLVFSVNTADDTAGTNPVAIASNLPIFVNGVSATAAKTNTIGSATGNFIVDFVIDPSLIPEGKTIGVAFGNSDVANVCTALLIEDCPYKPTPA